MVGSRLINTIAGVAETYGQQDVELPSFHGSEAYRPQERKRRGEVAGKLGTCGRRLLRLLNSRCVWQSGSGYAIYDAGINPEKAVTDTAVRKELGILTFEYDKMGPGRMMCAVPRVSEAGRAIIFKPMDQSGGIEAAIEAKQTEKIMYLRNKVGDASAVQHKHAY